MGTHPLRVIDFADGNEEPCGYYSEGHHGDDVFRAAVIAEVIEQTGEAQGELIDEIGNAPIERTYWLDKRLDDGNEESIQFLRSDEMTPGAYPVTCMRVEI